MLQILHNYSKREYSYPLEGFATVSQAEIYAICQCVASLKDCQCTQRDIFILKDGQTTGKALQGPHITSLVYVCQEVNRLGRDTTVTVKWILAHPGINGNERADHFTKASN